MGDYADLLEKMKVRVTSPDGMVFCTMTGPDNGDMVFAENAYRHYTERALEHQLSVLAKLIMVARRRAQRQALEAATGMTAAPEDPKQADPLRRRYLEQWDEMTCEGMSPGQCVYVSATGMSDFNVVIKDGTIRQLEEEELIQEIRGANEALLLDLERRSTALHDEIHETKTRGR